MVIKKQMIMALEVLHDTISKKQKSRRDRRLNFSFKYDKAQALVNKGLEYQPSFNQWSAYAIDTILPVIASTFIQIPRDDFP